MTLEAEAAVAALRRNDRRVVFIMATIIIQGQARGLGDVIK
jgi:hypothetical protein